MSDPRNVARTLTGSRTHSLNCNSSLLAALGTPTNTDANEPDAMVGTSAGVEGQVVPGVDCSAEYCNDSKNCHHHSCTIGTIDPQPSPAPPSSTAAGTGSPSVLPPSAPIVSAVNLSESNSSTADEPRCLGKYPNVYNMLSRDDHDLLWRLMERYLLGVTSSTMSSSSTADSNQLILTSTSRAKKANSVAGSESEYEYEYEEALACSYFLLGVCKMGASCRFAHSLTAPRPPCRMGARCTFGFTCLFSHKSSSAAAAGGGGGSNGAKRKTSPAVNSRYVAAVAQTSSSSSCSSSGGVGGDTKKIYYEWDKLSGANIPPAQTFLEHLIDVFSAPVSGAAAGAISTPLNNHDPFSHGWMDNSPFGFASTQATASVSVPTPIMLLVGEHDLAFAAELANIIEEFAPVATFPGHTARCTSSADSYSLRTRSMGNRATGTGSAGGEAETGMEANTLMVLVVKPRRGWRQIR